MWLLNPFVNCIILTVGVQGLFTARTEATDQRDNSADYPEKHDDPCQTKCPFHQHVPSKCGSQDSYHPPHTWAVLMNGMVCACNSGSAGTLIRDDYRYTPGIGSHKFHYRKATWNNARKTCIREGGHLAIINSFTEAFILMDIFNKSVSVRGSWELEEAFVGIHDHYQEGDWVTVLDESLAHAGYAEWTDKWGGQPDNGGGQPIGGAQGQNCGVMMRDGMIDDFDCDIPCAFFCEIPEIRLL